MSYYNTNEEINLGGELNEAIIIEGLRYAKVFIDAQDKSLLNAEFERLADSTYPSVVDLVDIYNMLTEPETEIISVLDTMKSKKEKVELSTLLKDLRQALAQNQELELVSSAVLKRLAALLIKLYGKGTVVGYNDSADEFIMSDEVDTPDLELMIRIGLFNSSDEKAKVSSLLYEENSALVEELTAHYFEAFEVNYLSEFIKANPYVLAVMLFEKVDSIYAVQMNQLFAPVREDYFVPVSLVNNLLDSSNEEGNLPDFVSGFIRILTKKDHLRNRKIVTGEITRRLVLPNATVGIDTIQMTEVLDSHPYIFVSYIKSNGLIGGFPLFINDIHNLENSLITEAECLAALIVFENLGLPLFIDKKKIKEAAGKGHKEVVESIALINRAIVTAANDEDNYYSCPIDRSNFNNIPKHREGDQDTQFEFVNLLNNTITDEETAERYAVNI